MNTVVAKHPFIELDQRSVPWVIGTNIKVREIIETAEPYRWDAREIVEHYPRLSLVNVFAAFCYYFDHKDEVDQDIRDPDREVERIRTASPGPPAM